MSAASYTGLLLLMAGQRIIELLYSKRNERKIALRQPGAPQADASGFTWIAALHVALFTLPAFERWRRRRPAPALVAGVGWLTTAGAIAVRLSVLASLRERWTVRAVVPADLRVVDGGPYRYIRHPNYVALGLEFVGVPLIGGAYLSAAALSAVNGVLLWRRIRGEEALLMAIPDYRQRMGSKPRFVPRSISTR